MDAVQLGWMTNSPEEKPNENNNLEKTVSAQILTFTGKVFLNWSELVRCYHGCYWLWNWTNFTGLRLSESVVTWRSCLLSIGKWWDFPSTERTRKGCSKVDFFIWVLPPSRPPNQLKSLRGRDMGNKVGPPHQGTEKQRNSERFQLIHSKARG